MNRGHYFKDREVLFERSMQLIRNQFQNMAIGALSKKKDAVGMFLAYVGACFRWIEEYPSHAQVWALFLHHCAREERYRRIHTEWTAMGQQRIVSMIQQGKKEGVFSCKNSDMTAKFIQSILTGVMTTLMTEEQGEDERQELKAMALKYLLELVGAK